MEDIKLVETCNCCNNHLYLMPSKRFDSDRAFLVKRCLYCFGYENQADEVIEILL